MILTGDEIKQEVKKNRIVISPFSEKQINPNSYNYHIGSGYIELPNHIEYNSSGVNVFSTAKPIPEDGLLLIPGNVYLCNTLEKIGSDVYVTSLIGKSSMGRLGLFLQLSADIGHQDQIHRWTLELTCCLPIKIYPEMVIGQVTFWKSLGEPLSGPMYYGNHDAPMTRRDELK